MAGAFPLTNGSIMRMVGFLKVAPQVDVQGDGHAHNDQRAHTQYHKPPDHPHSRLG